MSQLIKYDRTVAGVVTTSTITFTNTKYSQLKTRWNEDRRELRNVFSGKMKRTTLGYYLTVTLSYESISNSELFLLRDLFTVGTTNIRFYPDSASIENYVMDMPTGYEGIDSFESWQDGVELTLESVDRYETPIAHDIGYIGCRKIDISYMHITIDGTIVP